ncbi:hypothetical protein K491DRAFT_718432 [Lophiostoma macrostomum CBS 122681]|uniref:Uncharacterized protein n=1 Tax=Lophiostoma macrostomum CBS 122681 TaxID=1314788 RepID=A0A6A6T2A5_9PLEO|nr:hypothetical protein K491DRAFT_718432 [Lophiostoma macrostomum CBS 122681]
MTSNGEAALNASSDLSRPPSPRAPARSPRTRKTASPTWSRGKPPSAHRLQNGDNSDEDGENESEADTIVLGDAGDSSARERRAIKTERDDDDNESVSLRSIKEESRAPSLAPNGRKTSTSDGKDVKVNGAKHGCERDAKSSLPTSPSSRTASRHTKDTSPADSAKSPVQSAASAPQLTGRGRSLSTVESRKRKLRDEAHARLLEPPRQKAKTEGLKDSRTHPTSPATPGLGRPHKRSQSTQSIVHSVAGRKRRELTSLALPTERRNWSDSSSEHSSSPHTLQTPNPLSGARTKRGSHRALTSPARAMPAHKRNADRFGATRLAKECEKGDLPGVKAAHKAAPEELDQVDFAGIAPLQKAALNGWDDVVRYLIAQGCRTDCESNDRDTPLIDAVENGHLEVVKLLLDQGHVNPHHQNKKGQRAIDVLDPDEDDADEIERVLQEAMRREADLKDDDESQPGLTAGKPASRLLYNEYNTETLKEKCTEGDIAAVGELINSNIKPNIASGVAASRGGHYDILSILLASGLKADPDPSKHTDTPMLVAIGRGHVKVVRLLLEQDNFNPTRRNREGKTYYELSEERRGPKWEQERDALKEAYDSYYRTHRSPKRNKKEAPNVSMVRAKRKSSPTRREPSSSPRPETKRIHLNKSASTGQPQKSRRLMSGKEMANRVVKRQRRVVSDEETSDDESEDDVRPPTKKVMSKPRSFSDGEDQKPSKKSQKPRSEDHVISKKSARARSHDSEDEDRARHASKIRTKTQKIRSARPTSTPDAESPDERKPMKKTVKSRVIEGTIKKRRPSEASTDDAKPKKTHTLSAKSTPAPPEKAATPEAVRERREEVAKQAAEAKRKAAAEAEARKRQEEEAARKAAEEEELKRKAEAEAEAKRLAEEAEAARRREEEEARRREEEETRRQQELAARQDRISKLPRALRRACELGNNRPLHFSGEELGISAVFLPLFLATSKDLQPNEHQNAVSRSYIMSFQAVGILGLPELDIARLEAPFSSWDRISVSRQHRESLLRQYDVALLAQDFRFPMEGTPDFDYTKIQDSIKEARQQFLDMEGLYWIDDRLLYPEVEKVESLRPLLEEIKDLTKRRQLHVLEQQEEVNPEKKHRPRKSFMDVVLGQAGINGSATAVKVNGDG